MSKKKEVTAGSGNVFADIGIVHPDEALAKAELAHRIAGLIRERQLTQSEAASVLGVDQAKVSALVRGQVRGFSTDRLFRFLNALGQDVEIKIRRKPSSRLHAHVHVVTM